MEAAAASAISGRLNEHVAHKLHLDPGAVTPDLESDPKYADWKKKLRKIKKLLVHMRKREWCEDNCANADDLISWATPTTLQYSGDFLWSLADGPRDYGDVSLFPQARCCSFSVSMRCSLQDGEFPSFDRNPKELSKNRKWSPLCPLHAAFTFWCLHRWLSISMATTSLRHTRCLARGPVRLPESLPTDSAESQPTACLSATGVPPTIT